MGETSKTELHNTWESAAPGWAKWEPAISAGLSGATEALMDMAGIAPGGMRVLDIACGAGNQSIQVARRVGSDGRVVASDISANMLEHLRRNAHRAGLSNIETLECSAEDVDGMQGPFDAAISRLGLMLFSSPLQALKAVQHVLKPRARFAALVFTTPANNPFMAQPMEILLRHAGKSPPAPGQPGIFALGGKRVLENLMNSVLTDVRTTTVPASLRLPSIDDALEMMQEAFGAYRAIVYDLDDAEKSKAWSEVYDCLKQFEANGRFETKLQFIIASGAKQSS